jgi:hypothetical protein
MQWRTLAGMGVVTGVTLAVLGIVSNFALTNDLFLSSDQQPAALVSLGIVLLSLVVFAALGRPWRLWQRTPYW